MVNMIKLNLGKKGLTPEFIGNMKQLFVNGDHIRVTMLKSSTRDKAEAKKWAEEILASLGKNYTCKVIGYTLVLRKWRKAREAK
jgi:RNA-binding protein YhbY